MSDTGDDTRPDEPAGLRGWFAWFWNTDSGLVIYVRDVVTSVAAVLFVGLLLFGVSGIWPPMVAVESGSMEPNMVRGDLVFVVDNDRFVPQAAPVHDGESTGVIPADVARQIGHEEFGRYGDVIVYMPNGNPGQTPVIHRAMLWVEEGENWYDRADQDALGGADNCRELQFCPAERSGFITKGDNNGNYDQVTTLSAPVRPEWVVGTAELKVPYLGHIRLLFSGQVAPGVGPAGATPATNASVSAAGTPG